MRISITGSVVGDAAELSYGLAALGAAPVLLAAPCASFDERRRVLSGHGVDVRPIDGSDPVPMLKQFDDMAWVVVAADDSASMLARTRHVIGGGYTLVASPGQRLSRFTRDEVRTLVNGADLLFTNERERQALADRAEWTSAMMLSKVKWWVTTLGANGAIIESATAPARRIAAVPTDAPARSGGAGTGFRAGFLAALRRGADPATAARLGTAVATLVLETPEAQGFRPDLSSLVSRVAAAHGPAAARGIRALLTTNRRGRSSPRGGDLFAEDVAVTRVPGELLDHGEQGPSHADRALAGNVHGVVECEAGRDLA